MADVGGFAPDSMGEVSVAVRIGGGSHAVAADIYGGERLPSQSYRQPSSLLQALWSLNHFSYSDSLGIQSEKSSSLPSGASTPKGPTSSTEVKANTKGWNVWHCVNPTRESQGQGSAEETLAKLSSETVALPPALQNLPSEVTILDAIMRKTGAFSRSLFMKEEKDLTRNEIWHKLAFTLRLWRLGGRFSKSDTFKEIASRPFRAWRRYAVMHLSARNKAIFLRDYIQIRCVRWWKRYAYVEKAKKIGAKLYLQHLKRNVFSFWRRYCHRKAHLYVEASGTFIDEYAFLLYQRLGFYLQPSESEFPTTDDDLLLYLPYYLAKRCSSRVSLKVYICTTCTKDSEEYEQKEAKHIRAQRAVFLRVAALAFDSLRIRAMRKRKHWFALARGHKLLLRRALAQWVLFVSESKAAAAVRRRQRRDMKRIRVEEAESLKEKQRKVHPGRARIFTCQEMKELTVSLQVLNRELIQKRASLIERRARLESSFERDLQLRKLKDDELVEFLRSKERASNIRISQEIESFEFLMQVRVVRQFIDLVDKVSAKIEVWERARLLGDCWKRLKKPVAIQRALKLARRSKIKRLVRYCFRWAAFYKRYVIWRARELLKRCFTAWRSSARDNMTVAAANRTPGLYLEVRTRAAQALKYGERIKVGDQFSLKATFFRWLMHIQRRVARHRVAELILRRQILHSKRLGFYVIYHKMDPTQLLAAMGQSPVLKNITADLQTWSAAFGTPLRTSPFTLEATRIRKLRKKTCRMVRSRPRIRDFLDKQRDALDDRLRVEQRLLVGWQKLEGRELPPALLRLRRNEVVAAYERCRRFLLQLSQRAIGRKSFGYYSKVLLFNWMFRTFSRGLVSINATILPTKTAFLGHMDMLLRDARSMR